MSDCSEHKKEVLGCSDMKQLAEMIGDLHYQTLSDLLMHFSDKLWSDAQKDKLANRNMLADKLLDASFYINNASEYILSAWDISKPFMKQ